ncbi:MAG: acetyl-CoA acetyltransferase [Mycobacterium sp.]
MWILGGYESDFARNFDREGLDFSDLTAEVIDRTLEAAGLDATDIGVVHVANAFGELFAHQGHLGAMPATLNDGLWNTPATRHEAACASGSVATLAAIADLRSGAYRTALVAGIELEKTVPGNTATTILGAAAWTGHEGQGATFMWPHMFEAVAAEYDLRYGLDEKHLRAIAALNFANARANPNAQTRSWAVPEPLTDDDADNPVVEGRLRRLDCSQITDGAAGVVLVSDDWLAEHPGVRPLGRIDGAIDHIGLTGPGESWKAVENGEIEIGGRLPINPSGGLIGGGHPVGASGVRMLLDAARQVSGTAGDYQVEGAKTFGTLNFGGSTATTVSFVIGSPQ